MDQVNLKLDPEIKAEWTGRLRSGKYVQAEGALNRENASFCCLGVLGTVACDRGLARFSTAIEEIEDCDGFHERVRSELDLIGPAGDADSELAPYSLIAWAFNLPEAALGPGGTIYVPVAQLERMFPGREIPPPAQMDGYVSLDQLKRREVVLRGHRARDRGAAVTRRLFREKKTGRVVQIVRGPVHFCNQGGGFLEKLDQDVFVKLFEPVPADAFQYRRAVVKGEWLDDVVLPCWWDGKRWNGFGCPVFEFTDAMLFLGAANGALEYDGKRDKFVIPVPYAANEREEYGPIEIQTAEGSKKVYPIGTHGWCWTPIEYQEPKSFLTLQHLHPDVPFQEADDVLFEAEQGCFVFVDVEEMSITNPLESCCGRFDVDPQTEYGIPLAAACALVACNNARLHSMLHPGE